MFTISRSASAPTVAKDWLGEALLNWGFLRAGLKRGRSAEELSDHLRRDLGLSPHAESRAHPRDWRW
jgi:hypothetical protein